jgi:hypothetical protein
LGWASTCSGKHNSIWTTKKKSWSFQAIATPTTTPSGQSTLTGATLLLKFDATKLQLKAVRNGALLGNRAELEHYEQEG